MPWAPAVRIRSSHWGLASAGTRLVVSQRTRLAKSSGAFSASVWPIMPPIESPTQWVFGMPRRSEEHTSELQSRFDLVCRLLLDKKKQLHESKQIVDYLR